MKDVGESDLRARARMAVPLVSLAAGSDDTARPVRRALRKTLARSLPAAEAAWAERIEDRRARLMTSTDPTGVPQFEPATNGSEREFSFTEPETTLGFASAIMSLTPRWAALLMRIVRELQPRSSLELGTGFGISGSYQAAALELNGAGRLTTLEGSESWGALAEEGFARLGLAHRVSLQVGPLAATLPAAAASCAPLDWVFIDAEHQEQPTVEHFETVLPHLAERAVVAFDDVDWPDVRGAHDTIAAHPRVSSSIRAGRLGFVFVGPG